MCHEVLLDTRANCRSGWLFCQTPSCGCWIYDASNVNARAATASVVTVWPATRAAAAQSAVSQSHGHAGRSDCPRLRCSAPRNLSPSLSNRVAGRLGPADAPTLTEPRVVRFWRGGDATTACAGHPISLPSRINPTPHPGSRVAVGYPLAAGRDKGASVKC